MVEFFIVIFIGYMGFAGWPWWSALAVGSGASVAILLLKMVWRATPMPGKWWLVTLPYCVVGGATVGAVIYALGLGIRALVG